MTIKEFLNDLHHLSMMITVKEKQIDALHESAGYKSPKADGIHAASGTLKHHVLAVDIITLEEEIAKDRLKLNEMMRLAKEMIDSIDDPTAQFILTTRYFNGYTWKRITEESGFCKSYVHKIHGRGLEAIRQKYGDEVETSETK